MNTKAARTTARICRENRIAVLSVAFGLALAGCAPLRLWVGKSPDREHLAELWSDPGAQYVRVDGRDSPRFSDIGTKGLSWSPDSSDVAFAANTAAGWVVSAKGKLSGPWVGIGEIVWSPDGKRVAYSAQEKQFWTVVTDFRMGNYYDEIKAQSIVFSPDGSRIGYVVEDGRSIRAIVDEKPGPKFDGVGHLTFSGDSRHHIYLARRGDAAFLVIDDKITQNHETIADLVVGPTGFHWAILALVDRQWRAIIDGAPSPPFRAISSPIFSPNGKRIAYYAQRGDKRFVVSDFHESALYDEIAPFSLVFDAESQTLAFAARRNKLWRVVVNDAEGPEYDSVSNPVVAGDSAAYVATRAKDKFVVFRGVEGPHYPWIDNLVLDTDGKHHAYLASQREEMFVVIDSVPQKVEFAVSGTLAISADGHHWACLIANESRKKFYITIDGKREVPVELQEWFGAMSLDVQRKGIMAMLDQSAIIRRWVEIELARAIRPTLRAPLPSPSTPR